MEKEASPLPLETVDQVLDSYGVKLVFPTKIGRYGFVPRFEAILMAKFKTVDTEERERVRQIVANNLLLYPRDFFKRNKVQTFYIGHSRFNESAYHPITGTIVLNVEALLDKDFSNLGDLGNQEFNHELFHKLESESPYGSKFRTEWEKRFPRLTMLKSLYFKVCSKVITDYHHKYLGNNFRRVSREDINLKYIGEYAAASPREDRASTADCLMSESEYRGLLNMDSPIKEEKLKRVMSFYNYVSGGKMNETFWADYAMGLVDSNYWRTRS